MVRILANGDIVPDNDPRANAQPPPPNNQQGGTQRMGSVNQDNPAVRHGPDASIFTTFNQQLSGYGIPTWHIGPYPVEPIASLGFLLSLFFFGFGGLFLSGFIFFAVKYSQMGLGGGRSIQLPQFLRNLGFGGATGGAGSRGTGAAAGNTRAGAGSRTGGWGGSGQRLGDS
jgi:hypothetical protein